MSRNGHFLWSRRQSKSVTWTDRVSRFLAVRHNVRNFCVFEKMQIDPIQTNFRSRYIVFIRSLCRVVAALGIHQPNRIAKLIGTLYEFQKNIFRFSLVTCYCIRIILGLCCPFKSRKSLEKRPQNMVIFEGDWTSVFWKMFQITEV